MDHISTFIKKERNENTDKIVADMNEIGRAASSKRKGVLDRPMEWSEERRIYVGFYCDFDDGRMEFLMLLRQRGYKLVKYEARYHWKVESADGTVQMAYVEGDLYAKVM